MYLARTRHLGEIRFVIRESYPSGADWLSRDLVDLGTDPRRHIVYPGGNAYYVDESVGDALDALGVDYSPDELDRLFFPFVDPAIRIKLEWIANRRCRGRRTGDREAPLRPCASYHLFDRRRLLFLRFGSPGLQHLGRMPASLLRILDAKSRDEIEQHFLVAESVLKPHEIKGYVVAVLDLKRHFAERFAGTSPQLLDREKLDECFVDALCRLNSDADFRGGAPSGDSLEADLVRYLIMYFDHDFPRSRALEEMIRQFVNARRRYRPPARVRIRMEAAAVLFETTVQALRRMDRSELTRRFRQRAQQLHPDKGGDPEAFVKLSDAYRSLLRAKR